VKKQKKEGHQLFRSETCEVQFFLIPRLKTFFRAECLKVRTGTYFVTKSPSYTQVYIRPMCVWKRTLHKNVYL